MSYKIYKHLTSTNFRGITEKINHAKKDTKKVEDIVEDKVIPNV